MDSVAQRFGDNLRAARLACGLTQAELARRAGVQAVHCVAARARLERAARAPGLTTIQALLAALDAEAGDLVDGLD